MPFVNIDEIVVSDRFRASLEGIEELAFSIDKHGLLHPIIVSEKKELIAGERRLEACKLLGLDQIEVKYKEELNDLEKMEIELEENLQRQNLTWQEECQARYKLDTLKRQLYGGVAFVENGWGTEDTAQSLKVSKSLIKQDISLAKAMEIMPEITKAKNRSEAIKVMKAMRDKLVRADRIKKAELDMKKGEELITVICGDSSVELPKLERESFDMGIADPPFGIGLDAMSETFSGSKGFIKYEDKKEDIRPMVEQVVSEVYEVLKDGAHFYFFFAFIDEGYEWAYGLLRQHFDFVDPIPLIWYKTNKYGTPYASAGGPKRYMMQYQAVLFASKGGRNLNSYKSNVIPLEAVMKGRKHPAEMPSELMEVFVGQSSLAGEKVVDPFGGTGPVAVACKRLKRRCVIVERDKEMVDMIKENLLEEV